MSAEIRELSEIEDLRRLAELLAGVWGRPGEPSIDSDVLKALAHSGNYVSGAFAGAELIGGLVGWFGGVPPHEMHLHSHILGVVPGHETRGLGFELKQHQRRWCLARGMGLMEWTTDPLVRRNVYFNLNKLGAHATGYFVNFYGEMTDDINAGEESDRLLIRWVLDSSEAVGAAAGRAPAPQTDELVASGAVTVLGAGRAREPLASQDASARKLLCEVPEDIVEMRHSEPALARSWRLALRSVLTQALDRGYEITGATRSGAYVLDAPAE
jgi:predicted GNAT superfamily acetyltransferase